MITEGLVTYCRVLRKALNKHRGSEIDLSRKGRGVIPLEQRTSSALSSAEGGGGPSFLSSSSFVAVFHTAQDASDCAAAVQLAMLSAPWPPELLSHPLAGEGWAVQSPDGGNGAVGGGGQAFMTVSGDPGTIEKSTGPRSPAEGFAQRTMDSIAQGLKVPGRRNTTCTEPGATGATKPAIHCSPASKLGHRVSASGTPVKGSGGEQIDFHPGWPRCLATRSSTTAMMDVTQWDSKAPPRPDPLSRAGPKPTPGQGVQEGSWTRCEGASPQGACCNGGVHQRTSAVHQRSSRMTCCLCPRIHQPRLGEGEGAIAQP